MKKIVLVLLILFSSIFGSFAEGPTSTETRVLWYSFCAPSLCLSIYDIVQIKDNSRRDLFVPIAGICTGIFNISVGGYIANPQFKDLKYTYLGLGTTSILLSTCNLLLRPKKDTRTSFGFYSYPVKGKGAVNGISLTVKF